MNERKHNYGLRFGLGIVFLLVVFGSLIFGYFLGVTATTSSNPSGNLSFTDVIQVIERSMQDHQVDPALFEQVWNTIEDRYVDTPSDPEALLYGALKGLVAGLHDPYSRFLDPTETTEFNKELNGSFEGIGAEIGIKNNQITIIAPLPDSPAAQAGLRASDRVLAIDTTDTSGMSLESAVAMIRGEKGTDVVLTVVSDGEREPHDVTITRDVIEVDSVTWKMLDNEIAYVEINHFNSDTSTVFRSLAKDILLKNPRGMIIDVRNNPGGYLDSVIDIAGAFLDNDKTVVIEEGGGQRKEYPASSNTIFEDIPVVVLVNGGSASASEILAGALQDYNRATIVGEQTFGKGSVQDYEQFGDGSSLKLTVSRWLTPLGNSINEHGITPDEVVPLTDEDYNNDRDPQLDRALQLLTPSE